jgi:hypothetical protein
MELKLMKFHELSWNFMKSFMKIFKRCNEISWNSLKNVMKCHEISWNFDGTFFSLKSYMKYFMKFHHLEFYEIPWNSMKFHGISRIHEIRVRQGTLFQHDYEEISARLLAPTPLTPTCRLSCGQAIQLSDLSQFCVFCNTQRSRYSLQPILFDGNLTLQIFKLETRNFSCDGETSVYMTANDWLQWKENQDSIPVSFSRGWPAKRLKPDSLTDSSIFLKLLLLYAHRHRSILGAAGHIILTPANQLMVMPWLKIWSLPNTGFEPLTFRSLAQCQQCIMVNSL